jgi:hypothetical protein
VHLYCFGIAKLNARNFVEQLHRSHNLTGASQLRDARLLGWRQKR